MRVIANLKTPSQLAAIFHLPGQLPLALKRRCRTMPSKAYPFEIYEMPRSRRRRRSSARGLILLGLVTAALLVLAGVYLSRTAAPKAPSPPVHTGPVTAHVAL
jgi:hypothetical protein